MKEVNTQIATSMSSDFEEGTWTFLMPKGFQVWAGKFAIMDKQVYDKVKELVEFVDTECSPGSMSADLSHDFVDRLRTRLDNLNDVVW